jgi:hypothetical protein
MNANAKSAAWYREPWPWIVVSGPALAVIGCIVSVYLAVSGADPLIDDDYYQHGLRINDELARLQQAGRLRLQASLQVAGVRRGDEVRVQVASGEPLRDTAIRIRLVSPLGALAERSAVLGRVPGTADAATFYGQWLEAPDDELTMSGGNWRAVIEGAGWRVEGPAGADARLLSATGSVPP